jgi:hypothetical protein
MFGLPIVLAALSLMGAPSVPVSCNPAVSASAEGGQTWFSSHNAVLRIDLSPVVCAGASLHGCVTLGAPNAQGAEPACELRL